MTTRISTFSYRGQDIDVLYSKGHLSYVFEVKGERYGGAVKAQGKSIEDIMSATFCLIVNFLDTYEALGKKK